MKQTNLLKTFLLLCALVVGSTCAWADDVVLSENFESQSGLPEGWSADEKGGGDTKGASTLYNGTDAHGTGSGKAQGKAWKLGTNANPYGSVTTCALTTLSGDATLTFWARGKASKAPVIEISGIDCTITGDGTSTTTSGSVATGTIDGSKYTQYTVNISNGSSTSKITFRHAGPTDAGSYIYIDDIEITMAGEKSDPSITFNNGNVKVGKTLDLSTLFTSNSTGAVTYSITAGDSYASIDGNILTGVAVGSVTVKASQAETAAYNAKTANATITVEAAPVLSSIAITTAPTKTTYNEGETFDATGMVVTATYSDAATEDVTALCTWTPNGALTTSDSEITISYTENEITKTATQLITVNAAPVVAATLDFTDAGWGFPSSYTTTEETYTNDGYTITFGASNGHKKMVASSVTTGIIFGKKDATLSLPAFDFNVNKIKVYGISGASGKVTFNIFVGDDAVSTEVTGATGTQTFDIAEGKQTAGTVYTIKLTNDNNCQISKIEIFGYVPVTISAAGLATFASDSELDFTSVDGIEAYIAKENGSKIELTKVNKVPAGTGVLLRSVSGEAKAADVPVATTTDDVTGNLFVRGTGAAVESGSGPYNYVLGKHDGKVGFYKAGGMVVATNKAYLQTTVAAARIDIDFDGDVTAIETVKAEKANNEYYNLAGQRVAQPTKGLYIVNGRKVVVK